MYITDDPYADYDRWANEQERRLELLPKCSYCGEPIQQEKAIYINDEWICDECLNDNFRRDVVEDE